MVNAIESIGKRLSSEGHLEAGAVFCDEGGREITLTLAFSTPEAAAEIFNTVSRDLHQDGFRLGSLRLRSPALTDEGEELPSS